ncbi:hypothetical protein [Candidatus Electrothrix sp.]|uniref:hypothetical protein n=1 Tax=Candidatus Electrothrix sp. TaxID=2170559 RepID=UPI00405709D4
MDKVLKRYSRFTLAALTTLLVVIVSLLFVFIGYKIIGVELRNSEIFFAFTAPLLISSTINWYIYGLIKRLEQLEKELRESITKEKENVYLATIHGAQHVTNNLLNGLQLVTMEIENHPSFDRTTLELFNEMQDEAKGLLESLSSVKQVSPETILKSVSPKHRE